MDTTAKDSGSVTITMAETVAAPAKSSTMVETTATPATPAKPGLPIVARFMPAMATVMIWIYLVTYSHGPLDVDVYAASHNSSFTATPIGALWNELFTDYWPMTLAMIGGSLIAGSTPLGGGVVAFPVAVLVIGFKPAEGRDFTVLIQTVGMNAAAYLLCLTKPHLLNFQIISTFVIGGIPGVLVGLAANLHPFNVILTFQILVLEFAIVFFYLNLLAPRISPSAVPTHESMSSGSLDPANDNGHIKQRAADILSFLAAFAGGFITANVGSGSDIMLYAFGLLGWNLLVPKSKQLSDTSLTASSVVVMGLLSLVTSVCRAFSREISTNVLYCWGATCWLVVFGAPLGSLLLTPGLRAQLRIAFYVLAILQFLGFAVLKIKDNAGAWIAFAIVTIVVSALLGLHNTITKRNLKAKGAHIEPFTCPALKARLLQG